MSGFCRCSVVYGTSSWRSVISSKGTIAGQKSALSIHVRITPVSHRRNIHNVSAQTSLIIQSHTWDHISSADFDRPSIIMCYDNRINTLDVVKPECDRCAHVSRQFRFTATIKHQTLIACTLFIYVFIYLYIYIYIRVHINK